MISRKRGLFTSYDLTLPQAPMVPSHHCGNSC
jgi:hypothetical protein